MFDFAIVGGARPTGMISLRGDLADAALRKVCEAVTGAAFPDVRRIEAAGAAALAWMSPDELLVIVPHEGVAEALAALDKALVGKHYLAVDVSDARARFLVEGPGCREVMAKLCPADMAEFAPGQFRRTRMGQVAAAFWMRDAGCIEVICFRSVADYAFDLLSVSGRTGPVGVL